MRGVHLRYVAVLALLAAVPVAAVWGRRCNERQTASADGPAERPVVDDLGNELALDAPPSRVVSLVPSLTETMVAMGASDQLVGRTRFDRDGRVQHLPSVGGSTDPDMEALLNLRPDLLVAWSDAGGTAIARRLEPLGIPSYLANPNSVEDFRRHARRLGRLLGRAPEADSLVWSIDGELDRLRVEASEEERPGVLFVLWPLPLTTSGRGTFVDELIRLVGARGVFDDLATPWPTVSLEAVVARNPDLVVLAGGPGGGGTPDWIREDPQWRLVDAVRGGRVHVVEADLFSRPGPGLVEAARALKRLVDTVRIRR